MSIEFLQEIRLQFDRLIDLKERLDSKASRMMTVSGTVTTLFMGFGVFLLTQIPPSNPFLYGLSTTVLILEILFTTFTVKYLVDAYKIVGYNYPVGYKPFLVKDEQIPEDERAFDPVIMNDFLTSEAKDINQHFANIYLKGIRINEKNNVRKGILLIQAQRPFLGSIIAIPIFSMLVIVTKLLS